MDNHARAENIMKRRRHLFIDDGEELTNEIIAELDEACNEQWREDMKHCEADRKQRIDEAVLEVSRDKWEATLAVGFNQGFAAAREQDLKVVDSYLGEEDDTADKIGKRIRQMQPL